MSVSYRFNVGREMQRVPVESSYISVGDFKRTLSDQLKLSKGLDYSLHVLDEATMEEYRDDSSLIPKNSRLIVKRYPTICPPPLLAQSKEELAAVSQTAGRNPPGPAVGKDTGVMIIDSGVNGGFESGQMGNGMQLPSQGQGQVPTFGDLAGTKPNLAPSFHAPKIFVNVDAESDRMWAITQGDIGIGRVRVSEVLAELTLNVTGVNTSDKNAPTIPLEKRTPPASYICHRCKKPGHFIQFCPTNGNAAFDFPKMKKPTGIPRSFLKKGEDDEGYAVIKMNEKPFAELASALQKSENVGDVNIPADLKCPLCHRIFDTPVTVPCCGTVCCKSCISDTLLTNHLLCPFCNNTTNLEELEVNIEVEKKEKRFLADREAKEGAEQMEMRGEKRTQRDDRRGGDRKRRKYNDQRR